MRTIAHISDLHFGRVDPPVAEGLVDDLWADPASLLVVSGDFTQRARSRQYRQVAEFLRRLPTPQLVVPGNHDIPLYDLFRRVFFPLSRFRRHISADLTPRFADERLLVLGINTARSFHWSWRGFWKDGRISCDQMLDVGRRLGEAGEEVFKVLVAHHPFIPAPGERMKGMVGRGGAALDNFERLGLDMILSGHLHVGYSGDVRGHYQAVKRSILSIQAGTATSTRRRHEPNAYNRIVINPRRVSVHVRSWNGSAFAESAVTHYAKVNEEWLREG